MQEIYKEDQQKMLGYLQDLLVGPRDGDTEILDIVNPVDLYLMGMIHPIERTEEDMVDDDDKDENLFQNKPPSLGLSFYMEGDGSFSYTCSCAQYVKTNVVDEDTLGSMLQEVKNSKKKDAKKILAELKDIENALSDPNSEKVDLGRLQDIHRGLKRGKKNERISKEVWQRIPYVEKNDINKPTNNNIDIHLFDKKVRLNVIWRSFREGYLITFTMINDMKKSKNYIENQLFQSKIEVSPSSSSTISPYPGDYDLSYDQEEEELSLIYRDERTYAVGHSCAATWKEQDEMIISIATEFLPSVSVRPVTTKLEGEIDDTVLSLQYLSADTLTKRELEKSLEVFIEDYAKWALKQEQKDIGGKSQEAKKRILSRIDITLERMKKGIHTIVEDDMVFRGFKLSNLAMLMQMIHGKEFSSIKDMNEVKFNRPKYGSKKYNGYSWRPFQLAFVLLTIESVANKESDDRDVVDLIWFPTGGGKTEAYLAVSAFELFYRRMKFGEKGAGTVIIKRYTLRLLTAQQFQRASTLICACEVMRREDEGLLGTEPFSIGLWVGGDSSPNRFSTENGKGSLELYQETLEEQEPKNRFQVQKCPWCGTRLIPRRQQDGKEHYGIRATERSFSFYCPTDSCDFHGHLPMNVVDEALYMFPPSFIIGTIDKFARLAWDSRPGVFFGVGQDTLPPSLIIQDELHLISGPLGTIAGLYEAAIDTVLSTLDARPKMIAATATIRRADEQIQRLFAAEANIFPPIGVDAGDSYFARVDKTASGRLYIGVMSQSGTQTSAIVDVGAVLAEAPKELHLSENAKDAYWTQVIYHNSKKELSKTNTMASDDIPNRLKFITKDESKMREEPLKVVELSGNQTGDEMTTILEKMAITVNSDPDDVIDILPCTNVISVGVDVSRLGLMMMHGQPKTTSEYIQASSRVGRDVVPGIVVTVYPSANPRNRSHYENFIPYHRALYRYVEPTSVTPYAAPARDRALHAALVILMRHAGDIGEEKDVCLFKPEQEKTQKLIEKLIERMQLADPTEAKGIDSDMRLRITEWTNKIEEHGERLRYNNRMAGNQFGTLLSSFEETRPDGWPTLHSMRGVDAEIEIVIDGERL